MRNICGTYAERMRNSCGAASMASGQALPSTSAGPEYEKITRTGMTWASPWAGPWSHGLRTPCGTYAEHMRNICGTHADLQAWQAGRQAGPALHFRARRVGICKNNAHWDDLGLFLGWAMATWPADTMRNVCGTYAEHTRNICRTCGTYAELMRSCEHGRRAGPPLQSIRS